MMLGRVIGSITATAKNSGLEGKKLLLIQPVTKEGAARGRPLVAVDAIGAGFRETIYWCRGREAALAFEREVPTDATIVGIVDTITVAPPGNPGHPPKRSNHHRREGKNRKK